MDINGYQEKKNYLYYVLDVKAHIGTEKDKSQKKMRPNKKSIEDWKLEQRRESWQEYLSHCIEMHRIHKPDWDFIEKHKPPHLSNSKVRELLKIIRDDTICLIA